jgi:formimidoylglutamate deiminase
MILTAKAALLPEGWAKDVQVRIEAGRIAEVITGAKPDGAAAGCLLPAPVNLHSHCFQRAMAGMTEGRSAGRDTFWTWRVLMFRFLDHLTPEDVQAITALAMVEMAEAGFAAVAEFHYLHHQPGGTPYANLAEMSGRITAAAAETGLGLTLLPVLYQQGGCDGRALSPGQQRFGCDTGQFAALYDGASKALKALAPDSAIGIAPHSLRAVSRTSFDEILGLAPDGPVHMHLAEQLPEVQEVQQAYGARPVEWALQNLPLDAHWCLIHCTQMEPQETIALAQTGAVAGLCPVTEANLGDGIFDASRWIAHGGRFGVGSDSNIRISLQEELRALEYSQRLQHRGRAILAEEARSTGRLLYEAALRSGAQAAGRQSGAIAVGQWADLLTLQADALALDGFAGDALLDAWIFAGGPDLLQDLWSAGRQIVRDGKHVARAPIEARYRRVMADLRARL